MYLEIITPDQKVFAGDVKSVKVPGTNGSFEMLNNHIDIISTLGKGDIRVRTAAEGDKHFGIDSGIVEMRKNTIVILAEAITK